MAYKERYNFGAKFEPNGNYILHGTGQYDLFEQFNSYLSYRDCMREYPPLMTLAFIGLYNDIRYDYFVKIINDHIKSFGANSFVIPQIGLEFCRGEAPGTNYEKEIAEGEKDYEIKELFRELRKIDRPVFLRPGYGFNGEWNGYDAEYYKKAFVRIKKIMVDVGAENVSLVWSYNPAAEEKEYLKYYPGDDYVDWWGIDIFQTPEESAPYSYLFLKDAENRKKPVMLSEATAFRYGATLEGWEKWFKSFFKYIKDNPVIKAACYVNWDWTKYAKWSGWGDCRIETNERLLTLYKKEIGNAIWLSDTDNETVKRVLNYK